MPANKSSSFLSASNLQQIQLGKKCGSCLQPVANLSSFVGPTALNVSAAHLFQHNSYRIIHFKQIRAAMDTQDYSVPYMYGTHLCEERKQALSSWLPQWHFHQKTFTSLHIHIYVRTYIHTYIYTCIHTYKLILLQIKWCHINGSKYGVVQVLHK